MKLEILQQFQLQMQENLKQLHTFEAALLQIHIKYTLDIDGASLVWYVKYVITFFQT